MEVRYVCNLDDYAEVLIARGPRPLRRKLVDAVLSCCLIISCVFVMVNVGPRQGVATVLMVILLPAFWVVHRYVLFPLWMRRDFRRHPNFSREQILRIGEDGLFKKSEIGQSETKWAAYTRFQETQNLFVLYLGERLAEAVPKRALSGGQLHELRHLLREKLPQNSNTSGRRGESVSLA
jgi:hypothetical protein